MKELLRMKRKYDIKTVYLATDDDDILETITKDKNFTWVYNKGSRAVFNTIKWVDNREADEFETAALGVLADVELLSKGHAFIGHVGSWTSRWILHKMSSRLGYMPPYVSVDGFSICTHFLQRYDPNVDGSKFSVKDCLQSFFEYRHWFLRKEEKI